MKKYKTVTEPARTFQQCDFIECDFCGKKGKGDDWTNSSTYTTDETEIEVTIRHKHGDNWPSGGVGDTFSCDMCPDCFKAKLIPYLKTIAKNSLDYEDWAW